MPVNTERSPRRTESLIFRSEQEAQEFVERVEDRVEGEAKPGLVRDREVLSEEIGVELTRQGEDIGKYERPWSHDEKEHKEVQELVNLAFTEDLSIALKEARKSDNYPRLIDLFHDVLVSQLYEAMSQERVNVQKIGSRNVVLIGLVLVVVVIVIGVIVLV